MSTTNNVSLTDIQFTGNTPIDEKLRRLVADIQKIERAINALIAAAAIVVPDVGTLPHVLATITGLESDHTVSGLTSGMVLKAISDVNAAFAKLQLNDLSGFDVGVPANKQILQFIDGYWVNVNPSFAGEINDGTNEGTGAGLYDGKSGVTLKFKSIKAGAGIDINEEDALSITVSSTVAAVPIVRAATFVNPDGITTPINDVFLDMAVTGTIIGVRILTQTAPGVSGPGDCVLDLWKAPFGTFPPVLAQSITAATLPTISAANSYEDTALIGWDVGVVSGDVIAVHLNSVFDFTVVSLQLEIQPA